MQLNVTKISGFTTLGAFMLSFISGMLVPQFSASFCFGEICQLSWRERVNEGTLLYYRGVVAELMSNVFFYVGVAALSVFLVSIIFKYLRD
jgi:hypothetical protein